MKVTKKDFRENTKLTKIWNKVIVWNGLTLAAVMWHDNPWKVVDKGITFGQITDEVEVFKPGIFSNIPLLKRTYTPIAEFHTQEELWQYISKG
jgi:hypothetical protein